MRFIGADMPEVSDLTLGIMALVAEQEVKAVSRRTRDALPRPGHNWVSDIAKDMHVESHDMLIREAVRKALSADWPVNCAGINVLQPFLAVTVASFDLVQAVNPRAALIGAQEFARSCIARALAAQSGVRPRP